MPNADPSTPSSLSCLHAREYIEASRLIAGPLVANVSKIGCESNVNTTAFCLCLPGMDVHWENPYISEPLRGRQRLQPAENQSTKMIRNLAICLSFSCLVVSRLRATRPANDTMVQRPRCVQHWRRWEDDLTHVSAWYRDQWVNFNGGPVTTLINVHSNVDFIPGALGLQLYQDEIGQEPTPWSSSATHIVLRRSPTVPS